MIQGGSLVYSSCMATLAMAHAPQGEADSRTEASPNLTGNDSPRGCIVGRRAKCQFLRFRWYSRPSCQDGAEAITPLRRLIE